MEFREQLINQIKAHPDIFNEIRVESMVDSFNSRLHNSKLDYIEDPSKDVTLEELQDNDLINSIIRNLKYYIEYEHELGESDI